MASTEIPMVLGNVERLNKSLLKENHDLRQAREQSPRDAEEASALREELKRIQKDHAGTSKELAKSQKSLEAAKVRRASGPGKSGALYSPHRNLHATSILPESKDVRFLDAGVTAAVGAASVLWAATRPTNASQVGFALALTLLGGITAVEGTGELRYGGFGVLAANASFLVLKLVHPNLSAPTS
jgi:hypothetical protein